VTSGAVHGRSVIAHLEGIDDRDVARTLIGALISVPRSRFGPADPDQYYWADLIGLQVVNQEGVVLGTVTELVETGANDVLVVSGDRRRLLPFVGTVVKSVDFDREIITVDWDPEF